jgi:hypothetical protein
MNALLALILIGGVAVIGCGIAFWVVASRAQASCRRIIEILNRRKPA